MWDSVDSNKATEKQIAYAEKLLEAYYGDINLPIYTMSKQEISRVIDDVKKKCQENGVDYHNSTTEQVTGIEVEDRLFGFNPQFILFDEYYSAPNNFYGIGEINLLQEEFNMTMRNRIIEEFNRITEENTFEIFARCLNASTKTNNS